MDIHIKQTVLLEYRNRNLALFEHSMNEEDLKAAVMASGMLDGLAFAEDPYFDYFEAWSEASETLRDAIIDTTNSELDIQYAVGVVSGVIFTESDDPDEAMQAGLQEKKAICDLLGETSASSNLSEEKAMLLKAHGSAPVS